MSLPEGSASPSAELLEEVFCARTVQTRRTELVRVERPGQGPKEPRDLLIRTFRGDFNAHHFPNQSIPPEQNRFAGRHSWLQRKGKSAQAEITCHTGKRESVWKTRKIGQPSAEAL